ncbi:FSH1-domain-containing protein [Eremomyces bilateralis CBS 781.70]|uniref:FSH1-domain-containing protein n=1 Tax=Eremomyces bilateralis CBS 781.70 TaxID=1392243 RepID=A0A6G1FWU5_9PEZI|nr:FSH1-domain-containing protein [Eremomyces bilateralis CBS 781.70]KAF1810172.1 FSH1-domain-containing protein [Eremomyces bilateralis CBS 781.70]
MAAPTPTSPIKILMLHGFTQSGPLFRAKTRALEKNLQKAFPAGVTLSYPTGPIRLARAEIPSFDNPSATSEAPKDNAGQLEDDLDAWGWWKRKANTDPFVCEGLELGMGRVAEVLEAEGPFDGVIGFSQGGAMAAMVAALLEEGRGEAVRKHEKDGGIRFPEMLEKRDGDVSRTIHPPFKFAACYSGFKLLHPMYKGYYEPSIKTPVLHFLGSLDTVVDEKRSLALVDVCEGGRQKLVYHPGGHFLPSSQRQFVGALIAFMKEALATPGDDEEEKAEDMDLPF